MLGHPTLVLLCALWAVPILGLLVSSFRTPFDAARTGWWEAFGNPGSLTLGNYREVLDTNGLGEAIVNSLVVTVPAVVMMMTVGSVAAYGLARMPFRGRGAIAAAALVLAVVPIQVVLVPVLRIYDRTGLGGTFTGIWLVHVGLSLPFCIFLLRSFFAALPDELFQAAELDGADTLVAFVRIALPLSRPALASVRDLSVHLGLERPPHRPHLPRRRPGRGPAHRHHRQPRQRHNRRGYAAARRRGVHRHGPADGDLFRPPALLRRRPARRRGQVSHD